VKQGETKIEFTGSISPGFEVRRLHEVINDVYNLKCSCMPSESLSRGVLDSWNRSFERTDSHFPAAPGFVACTRNHDQTLAHTVQEGQDVMSHSGCIIIRVRGMIQRSNVIQDVQRMDWVLECALSICPVSGCVCGFNTDPGRP